MSVPGTLRTCDGTVGKSELNEQRPPRWRVRLHSSAQTADGHGHDTGGPAPRSRGRGPSAVVKLQLQRSGVAVQPATNRNDARQLGMDRMHQFDRLPDPAPPRPTRGTCGRGKVGPKIAWDISKQGGQMPEGPVRDSPSGPIFSQRRCLADHALQIRDLRHPGHLPAAGQLRRQIVQPTGLPQGGAGNCQKVRQIGGRWPAAPDRGAPTAWIKGQHAVRADPEDFAPHLAVDGPGPWHLPPSDRLHCRRGHKDDDSRHSMSDDPMRAGTLGSNRNERRDETTYRMAGRGDDGGRQSESRRHHPPRDGPPCQRDLGDHLGGAGQLL